MEENVSTKVVKNIQSCWHSKQDGLVIVLMI